MTPHPLRRHHTLGDRLLFARFARYANKIALMRRRGFLSPRRIYSIDAAPLRDVDAWLNQFRRFWEHHLDALASEIARGKRNRRPKSG